MFYLIPKYINCTKWNNEFTDFETFLNDLNPTDFCILGDLNARISEEQFLDKKNCKMFFKLKI